MHVRQVTMTPELAESLLSRNTTNRGWTPYRVTALAEAMRDGRFIPEAAGPVITGDDGTLHDGQHRLMATKESGHSWACILIEDAPEIARLHYDTGRKRSFQDYLRIRRIPNGSAIAATAKLLYTYEAGMLKTRSSYIRSKSSTGPDHSVLWDFYQQREDQIMSGIRTGRTLRNAPAVLVSDSVANTAAAVLLEIDPEDCNAYYKLLSISPTAGNIPPVIPVLNRAMRNLTSAGAAGVRGDQQHQMALVFKGWNLWRDGQEPSVLSWKLGGRNPEGFPIPH